MFVYSIASLSTAEARSEFDCLAPELRHLFDSTLEFPL